MGFQFYRNALIIYALSFKPSNVWQVSEIVCGERFLYKFMISFIFIASPGKMIELIIK